MNTPCRVLYIDDDAAIRRLVQRDLQRHGYDVTLAESGPEGENLVSQQAFDVICLDHYMPGQDGLETLAKFRSLNVQTPVIFVTGSEEGRLAVAALRTGATDYVIKEASGEFLTLLRATVDDALDREQLRRAKEQALHDLQEARDNAHDLAEQRAMLLREVNHRVANSLQLIASLTMLQERAAQGPETRAALAEVRSRIFAIAQVHRRLYTSDDVRVVALDEYLGGLLAELERSIGSASGNIAFTYQATKLQIPTDRAVSLGVVLAELVTNTVKYAYPDGQGGMVRVSLDVEGAHAVLQVEDDGVGFSAASRDPDGTGLGQDVIDAMADGLGAHVERHSSEQGVRVRVRFPTEMQSCA